jgi:dihydroorotase
MNPTVTLPGLADMHVHFREPGQTHKEDILSGSRAARAGGYTAVCCMPNTAPALDSPAACEAVLRRGAEVGLVSLLCAAALSVGQRGEELTDFAALRRAGVRFLSDDGKTLADRDLMRRASRKAKELDMMILDHCEDPISGSEPAIVARDIELCAETGCSFHLQHISAAESVALLRDAKRRGLPLTAETCPHYFALNDSAVAEYGTHAKMNPPLRGESDRLAVLDALCDGTLDCIATDHAPHSAAEKALPFGEAPFGIVGLETAFAVSYTVLVKGGYLTLPQLTRLMSLRPAELLGLPAQPPVTFDVETPYVIDRETFASKGRNTPFHGMTVYGRRVATN